LAILTNKSITVQDRAKVAINHYKRCRLPPKSTTVVLGWPWTAIPQFTAQIMRVSELITKIWKIDPHCHPQKCSPGTLLSGSIMLMRIFVGVP